MLKQQALRISIQHINSYKSEEIAQSTRHAGRSDAVTNGAGAVWQGLSFSVPVTALCTVCLTGECRLWGGWEGHPTRLVPHIHACGAHLRLCRTSA